jgi:hypothetical protein
LTFLVRAFTETGILETGVTPLALGPLGVVADGSLPLQASIS